MDESVKATESNEPLAEQGIKISEPKKSQRENAQEKSARAKRPDWIAIGISLCSLAISAISALSSLVPRDDVRVMIDRPPYVVLRDKDFAVYGKPQLTFINSGNRSAGIFGLAASAQRMGSAPPDLSDCNKNAGEGILPLPFDEHPFVLNPGEIKVVEVEANIESQTSIPLTIIRHEDGSLTIPKFDFKNGDRILICFQLDLATPDSFVRTWRNLAYIIYLEDGTGRFMPLFELKKPIVIKKSGWLNFQ